MYFKKGTWLVYEEETSLKRDSVVVFYNDDSLITFDGSTGVKAGTYEYFDCHVHSSFDDYGYYYTCNTTWSANYGTPVFRDKSKPGDNVGETITITSSNKIGSKCYPYTEYGCVTLLSIVDSLNINNKIFYSVKKYNDSKNVTENNDSTNFYISRYIGIVRKELLNSNKTWNLVNYHIVQ